MRFVFFLVLGLLLSCGDKKEGPGVHRQKKTDLNLDSEEILLVASGEIKTNYIDTASNHLCKAFGRNITIVKAEILPPQLKSTIHKERYRADSILRYLNRTYLGRAKKVIMLTHHDISTTKYSDYSKRIIKKPDYRYKDWAIFGLGSCPGYCCVVSTKRLWARNANEKTFLQRLKNISVHEIGHTFGLPHCPESKCVMNDANETIRTVDNSTGLFCEKCKAKLVF